jgi:hypothetical protein
MTQCLARLPKDIFLPRQKLLTEILELPFIHERLALGWAIGLG